MSNRTVCTAATAAPTLQDVPPVDGVAGTGAEPELKIAFISPGT